MAKIVQNHFGQIMRYSIYLYILDKYIHSQKYSLIFCRLNLFEYSFVIFLSCQIYLDIHLSNMYGNKYIRIFIRPKKLYSSHTGLMHICPVHHLLSCSVHHLLSTSCPVLSTPSCPPTVLSCPTPPVHLLSCSVHHLLSTYCPFLSTTSCPPSILFCPPSTVHHLLGHMHWTKS